MGLKCLGIRTGTQVALTVHLHTAGNAVVRCGWFYAYALGVRGRARYTTTLPVRTSFASSPSTPAVTVTSMWHTGLVACAHVTCARSPRSENVSKVGRFQMLYLQHVLSVYDVFDF